MDAKRKKVSMISRLTVGFETPHQRMQYLAGFLATLVMFIGGNFIGWASPVQIKLQDGDTRLKCSASNWSWAVAFLTLGAVPWAILAGHLADWFGRRFALLLSAPFYLIAWIMTYFATSCYVLFAARLIAGGGVAIGSAICSLYIAEITDKEIRGRVCSLVMFMQNFGVVFSLAVGPYVSYDIFIVILGVVPIIFLFTFCWMPESPFYRLKQGNRDAAMNSLLKFRSLSERKYLDQELDLMQDSVRAEMENKTTFTELIGNSVYRRALIIVLGVKTMQHFSGVTAIQSYMQNIFEESHSIVDPSIAGILCGLMQMVAGLFSSVFVDQFGRKPLLLSSAVGTAISLFTVGLYFFFQNYLCYDMSAVSWLPLVSIMLFMSVQPIGVGSLSYVLLGELFPTNIKGVAAITATMYGSGSSFIVTKLFDVISSDLDIFVTFWLCFIIIIFGIAFTIFFVPETKGKSLIQIQADLLHSSKKKERMIDIIV